MRCAIGVGSHRRVHKIIQIKEANSPTVRRPVKVTISPEVKICLERAELVTESYRQTEGQPWILRRAKGLAHVLDHMTVYIADEEWIVGNYASNPASLSTYPEFSYEWLEALLDDELTHTLDEAGKRRLRELNTYWREQCVEREILEGLSPEQRVYEGWTGGLLTPIKWPLAMMAPNYGARVFPLGLDGLLAETRRYRAALQTTDPDYGEKRDFYDAASIGLEALSRFALRFAQLAGEQARHASPTDRGRLEQVASACANVAHHPPTTFLEALQLFWFCHVVTTQIDWCSVGLGQRFDQIFWPFYVKDKAAGRITYEGAVQLFGALWLKLDDLGQINPLESSMVQVGGTKFQNVTIGGTDADGNDASNELSLAAIDATLRWRTLQPNLCLRYHDAIDPKLIDKAIECIGTGMGMPAFFNDNAAAKYYLRTGLRLVASLPASRLQAVGGPELRGLFKLAKAVARAYSAVQPWLPRRLDNWLDDLITDLPYELLWRSGPIRQRLRRLVTWSGLFDAEKPARMVRAWAPMACVGPGIPEGTVTQGTLTTLITAGVVNFLKCVEYVMYQGVEPQTGEQLGVRTPDPRTFRTYSELLDAYMAQLKFQAEKVLEIFAVADRAYAHRTPRPLASILMSTPVLRGRDATHVGDMADSEMFSMASVNAADALTVIKRLVFDERSVTMDELIRACAANWNGFEALNRRCSAVPKFGNDDEYADSVLVEMYRRASREVHGIKNHFGGPARLEATLAAAYFFGGLSTGATPDGRFAGETVSDGQLSPMHGCDLNGPTAVLKSCSKVDPAKTWNQLVNQKFPAKLLREPYKQLFSDYLRTWFELNNWHIQFNCQDAAVLRDARAHPERHGNLIVRVAGYSAYFVDLTPRLQADIIRRTEQELAATH